MDTACVAPAAHRAFNRHNLKKKATTAVSTTMTSRRARGDEPAPPSELRFPLCTPGGEANLPALFATAEPGNRLLHTTYLGISEKDADALLDKYNAMHNIGNGNALYLSDYDLALAVPSRATTTERISGQVNVQFTRLLHLWIQRDLKWNQQDSLAVKNKLVAATKGDPQVDLERFDAWHAKQLALPAPAATARGGVRQVPALIVQISELWREADAFGLLELTDRLASQPIPVTDNKYTREAKEWFKIVTELPYWRTLVLLNTFTRRPSFNYLDLRDALLSAAAAAAETDSPVSGLGRQLSQMSLS